MKKNFTLTYLVGALLAGAVFTACDNFKEDVPPARMSGLHVNNDHYTTVKNQGMNLDVLANDTIGSTATLTFTQPSHGAIQPGNGGNVYYQPDTNYTGPDSFTYTACLGNNCASAVVNIDVRTSGGTDTTTCNLYAFNFGFYLPLNQYASLSRSVLSYAYLCGEDSANTSVVISRAPKHNQAYVNSLKQIVYTSNTNYAGPDSLLYTISNSKGQSTGRFYIQIKPLPGNCTTTARPDSAFTKPIYNGSNLDTVSVKVLGNDTVCPNAGLIALSLLNQSTNKGTITLLGNNRILYETRPGAPAVFNDSFQYMLCQGGPCSTTTVYIRRK